MSSSPIRKGGDRPIFLYGAGLVPALKGNHKGRPYNPFENPSFSLALWRLKCNAIDVKLVPMRRSQGKSHKENKAEDNSGQPPFASFIVLDLAVAFFLALFREP